MKVPRNVRFGLLELPWCLSHNIRDDSVVAAGQERTDAAVRSFERIREVERMKKILVVLALAVVLVIASCATAPEPEPEAPVEQPAPEPAPEPEPQPKVTAGVPEKEYSQAKELKAKVDRYRLGDYAPEEYAQAEQRMAEAEKAYQKDNAAAKKALDGAIQAYNAVISKGFPLLVDEQQKQADSARSQADSIKSQGALPDQYARAKAKYDEAVAARKAGDFESAIAAFAEAQRLFQDLYVQAKAKKDRAEQSMRSSQEGLQDAEQRAKSGDAELQGAQ
jgi:tetratricopeptide (TPR) repeat protein